MNPPPDDDPPIQFRLSHATMIAVTADRMDMLVKTILVLVPLFGTAMAYLVFR